MILAIDSSAGTAVAVTTDSGEARSLVDTTDRRSHAEVIGPLIRQALSEADCEASDIEAVVMGVGPGPFTGLRVGMAAAQAFAWGQDVPLWPVRSHDAAAVDQSGDVLVVSDARRGEWACTRYRTEGPNTLALALSPSFLIPRAQLSEDQQVYEGAEVYRLERVDPSKLVRVALARKDQGVALEKAQAIYLRAPDVTMPK